MFLKSGLGLAIAAASAAYLVLLLAQQLLMNSQKQCTIVITGESVSIVGCVYSDAFIELVKGLKPYYHPLG
ncbi:triple gene block protein 3 [Apple green crinkle associated virus]|uniref:triple gene block protein 3 n=1 Tax=Apple green crinkle associated virus TaxID=1211388 RepID=UPI0002841CA3|nr:triple gene block protein 3 [Apple green crinkle associated virus]CCJ34848.1 triple gene block protein 3 [Apple green crinkle associated virus]